MLGQIHQVQIRGRRNFNKVDDLERQVMTMMNDHEDIWVGRFSFFGTHMGCSCIQETKGHSTRPLDSKDGFGRNGGLLDGNWVECYTDAFTRGLVEKDGTRWAVRRTGSRV